MSQDYKELGVQTRKSVYSRTNELKETENSQQLGKVPAGGN